MVCVVFSDRCLLALYLALAFVWGWVAGPACAVWYDEGPTKAHGAQQASSPSSWKKMPATPVSYIIDKAKQHSRTSGYTKANKDADPAFSLSVGHPPPGVISLEEEEYTWRQQPHFQQQYFYIDMDIVRRVKRNQAVVDEKIGSILGGLLLSFKEEGPRFNEKRHVFHISLDVPPQSHRYEKKRTLIPKTELPLVRSIQKEASKLSIDGVLARMAEFLTPPPKGEKARKTQHTLVIHPSVRDAMMEDQECIVSEKITHLVCCYDIGTKRSVPQELSHAPSWKFFHEGMHIDSLFVCPAARWPFLCRLTHMALKAPDGTPYPENLLDLCGLIVTVNGKRIV